MAAGRNKVLLDLAGRPLIMYPLATLRACCSRVLIVSAPEDMEEIQRIAPDLTVVPGGATRHGSEWNGLRALRGAVAAGDVVALHDAARPLVSAADVAAVFEAAEALGAAMLAAACAVPAIETRDGRVVQAHDAAQLWRAQTPQAARGAWLIDAYERAAATGFDGTDTAAVLSGAGYACRVVVATAENPKVTVPGDLARAEALLAGR